MYRLSARDSPALVLRRSAQPSSSSAGAIGCEVIAEFREVESGRKSDRPVLRQALAYAKAKRATLLIAKLDRLARNVAFIANLMEAGVEFRACDLPEASRFILHVMAAVAEQEARAISDRTRAAFRRQRRAACTWR